MGLSDQTREGLTKPKGEVDLTQLRDELYKDQQNKSANPKELQTDLAEANRTLHANGFPTDFVIIGVTEEEGKQTFKTNRGNMEAPVVASQMSAEVNQEKTFVAVKSGEHVFQTKGAGETKYTVENGVVTKVDHGKDGYWERDAASGTYHYYKDGQVQDATVKPFKGTMTLDSAGTVTTTYEDKTSKVERNDGRTEYRDAQGRVTKTESADKKTVREFQYDGDTVIVTETIDGTSSGYKVKASDVSKNGDVTVDTTNGDQKSHEVRSADGTTVKYDDNAKPPRVSEVHYPNGKSNKFEYDDGGNIVSVTDESGNVWKPAEHNCTASVDDKGNYTVVDCTDADHPVTTTKNRDGSEVKKDDHGRVTSVTHPDGSKDEFEYEGDSKQVKCHKHTENGGQTETVFERGKDGNKEDDVSVDDQGNITTTKDGKKTRTNTDGSKEDATNQFEYDSDGNAKLKIEKGMTLWKIAEKALKEAGLPTDVKSVHEYMKQIQEANKAKIKDINKIYAGDELVIPKPRPKKAD